MLPLMRVLGVLLIPSVTVSISTSAQAQTPTPQVASAPVIQSQTRLVVLDVVVTDAHGDPVNGLSLKDFELRENGIQRALETAEEHGTTTTATSNGSTSTSVGSSSASGFFSNRPPSEQVWNVLLVDLLNPSWERQQSARQQLEKFVQNLPGDQPVALVKMGDPSTILVPFSHGAAGIRNFFANAKASAQAASSTDNLDQAALSAPEIQFIDNDQPNAPVNWATNGKEGGTVSAPTPRDIFKKGGRDEGRKQMVLVIDTFSALANWLNHYPGRKNVYWLSDGFPTVVEDKDSHMGWVPAAPRRDGLFGKEQQRMDKLLQNARVAVFPIDISGLKVELNAAGRVRVPMSELDKTLKLQDFAEQTGGMLRHNDNDIGALLREEFNRNQDFYTLTYTPSGKNWNGQYRQISLAVRHHNVQLAYRHGYYAIDTPAKAPTEDDFKKSLGHGAEQVNDVVFSVHPRRDGANLAFDYSIDPQSLRFAVDADGRHNADVDCAVAEYDSSGKWLGTVRSHGVIRLTPKQWSAVAQTGLPGRMTSPLAPGVDFFKIGIRDAGTGRFGTLEVSFDPAASFR